MLQGSLAGTHHQTEKRLKVRWRRSFFPVIAAVGLAFLLFAIYRDNHVHFSPQSRQCVIAARSLLENGTFGLVPGRLYSIYGPLYPIFLAGPRWLNLSLSDSIVLVNSLALSLSVFSFFWIARDMGFRRPWVVTLFYAALAVNPYLFRMARADCLFVGACMLATIGLSRYASSGGRGALLVGALGCALATTSRYIGIYALGAVCAIVFWRYRRPTRTRVLVDLLTLLLIGWGPIALWSLRNHALTGFYSGMDRTGWYRDSGSSSPLANLLVILETMAFDFLGVRVMGINEVVVLGDHTRFRTINIWITAAAVGLLLAGIVISLAVRGWRRKTVPRTSAASSAASRPPMLLVETYTAAYLMTLVVLWSWGNMEPIYTRYVAPAYWGIVLLTAHSWRRLREIPGTAVLRWALAGIAAVVLAANVDKSIRLLGEDPEDELIPRSVKGPGDAWLLDPTWEREGVFQPLMIRDRVVGE